MAARRQYSAEEIDLALAAFAVEGGRKTPVEALLKSAKLRVKYCTVRTWAYQTHHERYEQIAVEVEKQVRTRLADSYQRLAKESAELSEGALERIRVALEESDREIAQIDELIETCEDTKELAGLIKLKAQSKIALRDLAKLLHESGVMGGIATEKLALLTGNATERVEHSFPELRRALEAKGVRLVLGQGQPSLPPKRVPALVEASNGNGNG